MFEFISSVFPLLFLLVLGVILFQVFKGIGEWSYNNRQPVLTVDAQVVSKRSHMSRHAHHHDHHVHHHVSTIYYVTFEVDNGDRMELRVNGKQYGLIAEGDIGRLTFQGTRFHGFERAVAQSWER